MNVRNVAVVGILFLVLWGCGGGGGGNNPGAGAPPTPTSFPAGTPNGPATTGTLGPAGGTLATADGKITLTFPAGALAADTTIEIQPITNTAPGGLGTAYRLSPGGTTFANPVQITFPFTDADLAGSTPEALGIGFQDDQGFWRIGTNPVRDDAAKTITVTTTHFSDWSRLLGWQIVPAEKTIESGDQVGLTVVYCEPQQVEGDLATLLSKCPTDDDLPALPDFAVEAWAVDGTEGGDLAKGVVTRARTLGATYTSPPVVSGKETHAVSARLKRRNGQTVLLVSNITVVGEGGFQVTGTFDVQGNAAVGMDICPQNFAALSNPHLTDRVAFLLVPQGSGFQVEELQNTETTLTVTPITIFDGSTARMDSNPVVFTANNATVISLANPEGETSIGVNLSGTFKTGGCVASDQQQWRGV